MSGEFIAFTPTCREGESYYVSDPIYLRAILVQRLPPKQERRWDKAGNLDIRGFVHRRWIDVRNEDAREKGRGSDKSQLARLEPEKREVWEIRSIASPQMRFLGSFAVQNVFVALVWRWKEDLLKVGQYDDAIDECEKAWANLFGGKHPVNGAYPHDYLTDYRFER